MRAVHGLDVHLGVPVAVEEHDDVGLLQVEAQATGARREEEEELVAVLLHEGVDHLLARVARDATVDAAVLVAAVPAVVLEDVEHARHLAEDQYARAFLLALVQQPVKHAQLGAVVDKVVALHIGRAGLLPLEQVRVVGALAQLHNDVQKARSFASLAVDGVNVLLENVAVELALHARHGDVHVDLRLGRQALLHVRLQPTQQERPQDAVELRRHLLRLLRALEEGVELVRVGELVGQKEVEQRPQLVQVVLQRGTGEQQARVRLELAHHRGQLGVLVLDAVRLIDDEVAPVELLEVRLLAAHDLERRHHHVELVRLDLLLELLLALLLGAAHVHHAVVRQPLLELLHPVGHGGLRRENHVRAPGVLELGQVADHGDCLDSLAQTHLVGQNSTDAVVVETNQPVQPFQLIFTQGPIRKDGRLLG
mmetsp:Transcript_59635/g.158717  ORF Transcript_59635/g.158717 Transcript_59635/m.158717 type:complete len:424 (-) Transcript_59635:1733-3004(-)